MWKCVKDNPINPSHCSTQEKCQNDKKVEEMAVGNFY